MAGMFDRLSGRCGLLCGGMCQAVVIPIGRRRHHERFIRIVTLNHDLIEAATPKSFFCHHRGRTRPLQRHGHNREQ